MEDDYFKIPYKKTKALAHDFYRKIGKVTCPYFDNSDINFTNDGFNHLIRKGRTPRPRSEQKKRFFLLPFVKDIINNSNPNVTFKQIEGKRTINRHGRNIEETVLADFWTFIHTTEDGVIKVVVRRLKKDSPKHFFSVMANKKFFNKKFPR